MLGNKTVFSVGWSFLETMARRGISVITTLALAYFLTPEDYGLVAMMSLFLALGSTLVESGFKQALIRKSDLDDTDLNTAFYANICLSVLAYVILYLSAPIVAGFYTEPTLVALIRVASLLLLVNAFQIVQAALLAKKMQFKLLVKASFPAALLSGVIAILLAYSGMGVWSLVVQMLASALFTTLFLWIFSSWRPSKLFSFESLGAMYNFGYKLFLSSLLNVAYKNMFVLVIAKFFTVGLAGLYFFADRIKDLLVSQLIASIQTVMYSALSEVQNDTVRLSCAYRKIMKAMTFLVFPALLIFAALAELIFRVALPEKWLPAVPFLQLLCIASLSIPITSVNLNIIKVKGKSGWYLLLETTKKLTGFTVLWFTLEYGVIAILLGHIIVQALNYYPSVYLAEKLVGYGFIQQLQDFMPSLILATIVAGLVWCLQINLNITPLLELMLLGALSVFLYLCLAVLIKSKSLALTIEMVKNIKNSRRKSKTP
jgi:O-antigen/teichoic acid export membrane protein